MNAAEEARIAELARRRAAELAASGLVARKAFALKSLGWPEAVRAAQQAKAS
jgi:hypothetical protein